MPEALADRVVDLIVNYMSDLNVAYGKLSSRQIHEKKVNRDRWVAAGELLEEMKAFGCCG